MRLTLAVVALLVALAACGSSTENVLLGDVYADVGGVSLGSGCWQHLDAEAELVDGQIVVAAMTASGRIDGDCLTTVRTGLAPGPDVVHPEASARWALFGDTYRKVDYCGVDTRRCVPFPRESVPPSCSEESLQYATVGMNDGVYPIEVLRCDLPWALIELDRCGGYHGDDGRLCTGDGITRIIMGVTDGQWNGAGFQEKPPPYAGQQQLPAACGDDPDVPDWVCEIVE